LVARAVVAERIAIPTTTLHGPNSLVTAITSLRSNCETDRVIVPRATGSPSSFSDSGDKDENIHVRKARSEARQVIRLAKRKRNEDDEDDDDHDHDNDDDDDKAAADDSHEDDVDIFYDAHTGLTDDEDEYMTAVEEQPAVWPILRRRRRMAGGRKKKVKIMA
jgi:hypothetical protein